VKLYAIIHEEDVPEYIGPLSANANDTYAQFWVFLETKGFLNWPFNFWVKEDK
jgi:hypothetical protein